MGVWSQAIILAVVVFFFFFFFPHPSSAQDFPALGREIVQLVRTRFYDPARAERWTAENADYAAKVRDDLEFRDETRKRLAALKASHTEYFLPTDPGYRDLLSIFEPVLHRPAEGPSPGFGIVETAEGRFVARVFLGGPADTAGLRRGDRVYAVDAEAGRIQVQSRRDGEVKTVAVNPRRIDPKKEWEEAQRSGTRVVERNGHRVGYVPVWSCAGVDVQGLLAEAFATILADAEALVLDLRSGWGGCNPELVALFDPAVPVFTRIDRKGKRSLWAASWRKPLVVLIDGGSRSGKEVVARALQKSGRATLVGERTAGWVLAGQPFLLSDGSLLYLAVQDVLSDGERLEGVGVKPDVEVAAGLPYAEGKDPQLERALDVAVERIKAR
jgi:carboxyl-terminal processing protease